MTRAGRVFIPGSCCEFAAKVNAQTSRAIGGSHNPVGDVDSNRSMGCALCAASWRGKICHAFRDALMVELFPWRDARIRNKPARLASPHTFAAGYSCTY